MEKKKKYDVYLSYNLKNQRQAKYISILLEKVGFSCFYEISSLPAGVHITVAIQDVLVNCKVVILLLSADSVKSEWALRETEYALNIGKRIIPIIIGDSLLPEKLPMMIRNIKYIVWREGSREFNDILIQSVRYYVEPTTRFTDVKSLSEKELDQEIERLDNYVPQKNDYNIFISYRRIGGRDCARTIQLKLESLGFNNIFFDYSSLRDGIMNTQIIDAIYSCNDFLLILSPDSMNKCKDKGDWVASEIRTAIKYERNIIPITMGEEFEWPKKFPSDLNQIKNIQRHKLLYDEYFDDSMLRLSKRLNSIPKGSNNPGNPFFYKVISNKKCTIMIDNDLFFEIEKDKLRKIPLRRPGEYYVVLVDAENESNCIKKTINIKEDKVDVIEFK